MIDRGILRRFIGVASVFFLAAGTVSAASPSAATPVPAPEADALHVLNRLAYGPAPGDLERVRRIGVDAYIDEQLHPERLPLPPSLRERLESLPTTRWSEREIVTRYRALTKAARDDGEAGKAARREFDRQAILEAARARLLSAVESPRQLQEVMVDFWFNHFNVYEGKGIDRVLVQSYEREAIRPHALGRFRDLLGATAHHPAMLFYLDNWLSAAPGPAPTAKANGLNENYARELMELHTLGVDGGYTQRDVTELARMLTGWTFDPRQAGRQGQGGQGDSIFFFDSRRHDGGDKEWLGRHVGGRGQAEGEWALDLLAAHPSTARHIAFELARYFVADEPPTALVERLARRFLDTAGDIREVLRTLFDSPEFRAPAVRGVKFKTPYRYLVSALRASNLTLVDPRPLLSTLRQLGMPLYGCPTPDGYKNTEEAWLNPDAVTRRIGFATALAAGKLPLSRPADDLALPRSVPTGSMPQADATPPVDLATLLDTLGDGITAKTRGAAARADPALRAALVLGSPDFMRH